MPCLILWTLSSSAFAAEKPSDTAFLTKMIHHHTSGIMMSEIAVKKAQKSDLKAMAEKIIKDQTREITAMQAELKRLGESTEMDHSKMGQESDMKELEKLSGEAFDSAFIKMMVNHHKTGIEQAKPVAKLSANSTVKDIASKIVEKQTREISELEKLLKT